MMIFLDTSGIVAAMNARDSNHVEAKQIFQKLAKENSVLVMTNYIRIETHALLLQRAGREIALRFLEVDSWLVEWVTPEDERKAIKLLQKYRDKNFPLTDATSFVIMDRLKINNAVSFDQHFRQFGKYLP
jgi:predicted nucleic acid-binding protein